MDYRYLIDSPLALVRYLACNLLTKGYHFYSITWLLEDCDALLVDARLIISYSAHLTKERQYRRGKARHAKVRYIRCGRMVLIFATRGNSPFFEREDWHDIRERSLHLAGHALRVRPDGKVSVRITREAQRKLRRALMEKVMWESKSLEKLFYGLPFLPFRGVRDNLVAEYRYLNKNRKSMRKEPLDWKECIRKRFAVTAVFEPSPPEILELLRDYR